MREAAPSHEADSSVSSLYFPLSLKEGVLTLTEHSQFEGMIQRLRASTKAEREGPITKTLYCDLEDHAHCPGMWTVYPDEEGPCGCECHAQIRSESENA